MKLYFDESGDFNTARAAGKKFAFVMGIIVPENAADPLKADFDWFANQLSVSEFARGEAKGSLLTLGHRRVLLEILKAHRDVMLVPVSLNLERDDLAFFARAPFKVRELIESNLPVESPHMSREQRGELAKRFGRLSGPAMVRLVAYGIAIFKAIEAIACRYNCSRFYSDYEDLSVTFDRVGRAGSREQLIFHDSLFGWISNWSRSIPIKVPAELRGCHPLLARYGDWESGRLVFDLRKMLQGKIAFKDSKLVWQLRLADFVASTWSQTIADHDGSIGCRDLFRDLYRKSALPNETPLGLVGASDRTESVPGPRHLEIFARIVADESKILPCD